MMKLATKSPASQQPGQEQQQLIVNADAELISLQSQIEQAQQAIVSARAEIQSLDAKAQARQTRLTTASSNAGQAKNAYDEGMTRATLSQGTATSGQVDVAGLKRQAERAQQEFTRLQIQLDREIQSDDQRRAQVQMSLDIQQQTLSNLLQTQTLTTQVRDKAFFDQGEAILRAHLETVEALQAQIAEREQQLAEAKATLDQWGRQAVNTLDEWPDLATKLVAKLPFENPTTEVLASALEFVTALLEKGSEIETFSPHFFERVAGLSRYISIDGLLSLDRSDVWPLLAKYTHEEPVAIQQRQRDLEQLLRAYRKSKQGGVKG